MSGEDGGDGSVSSATEPEPQADGQAASFLHDKRKHSPEKKLSLAARVAKYRKANPNAANDTRRMQESRDSMSPAGKDAARVQHARLAVARRNSESLEEREQRRSKNAEMMMRKRKADPTVLTAPAAQRQRTTSSDSSSADAAVPMEVRGIHLKQTCLMF